MGYSAGLRRVAGLSRGFDVQDQHRNQSTGCSTSIVTPPDRPTSDSAGRVEQKGNGAARSSPIGEGCRSGTNRCEHRYRAQVTITQSSWMLGEHDEIGRRTDLDRSAATAGRGKSHIER